MLFFEVWFQCQNVDNCGQFMLYSCTFQTRTTCPYCGSEAKKIYFPPLVKNKNAYRVG